LRYARLPGSRFERGDRVTVEEYTVGVDIGGTFTDCIVVGGAGGATIGKSMSTREDLSQGVLDSITAAASKLGLEVRALLGATRAVYHGSTVGTNALVEGRNAKVGLLATRGHGDAIFFMQAGERLRGYPPETIAHVAAQPKPTPLVDKRLVQEVDERVAFDGNAVLPLNEDSAREAIDALIGSGAEAIAVSLLWSFANPAHEIRIRELLHDRAPDMFVSLSHEVAPRAGEYQRTVATVINASIGPIMDGYLGALQARLHEEGYPHDLQLMSCSGGVIDLQEARLRPALTIGSGPTAGVIGTRALAARLAADSGGAEDIQVVTTDMGGTTLDVGVISGGKPLSRSTSRHEQYEYYVPTVDVRSIGAGGGSIIRYNEQLGSLTVGPRSAGSLPGPACYGRGGTAATITDADLVLGYLDPLYFLDGRMALDLEAAVAALASAGSPLGLSVQETAAAAAAIADNQIADAIRLASIQQGYDPRDFVLYAYGGAGPVHASGYARGLGVERIVIPLSDFASGWSAFGVASSDAVVVREIGHASASPFEPDLFNHLFPELEDQVRGRLRGQGIPSERIELERIVDMKYRMQVNELPISAPLGTYGEEQVNELLERFEGEYARLFGEGSGYPAAGYAITGLRVRGTASTGSFSPAFDDAQEDRDPPAQKGDRPVIFYETPALVPTPTPVYSGSAFTPGVAVDGPAIIEFPDTTVVVRPGQSASVDRLGSVNVRL
jgi:N-methylhydantoinase A